MPVSTQGKANSGMGRAGNTHFDSHVAIVNDAGINGGLNTFGGKGYVANGMRTAKTAQTADGMHCLPLYKS